MKTEIDIRKIFKELKSNESPVVRTIGKTAEYVWDTGIILGAAVREPKEPTVRKGTN